MNALFSSTASSSKPTLASHFRLGGALLLGGKRREQFLGVKASQARIIQAEGEGISRASQR